MPESCPNPYGCEWGIAYFWRWMAWYGHLDVIVLALMLAYVFAIAIHVSYRCVTARKAQGLDEAGNKKLDAELNKKAILLRSIAFVAPYLGLAGTSLGILNMFRGFVLERSMAQAMLISILAAAFVATAAGILVAIAATCCYNYVCARLDLFTRQVSRPRLPLQKRFSQFPPLALVAATSLALVVAVWTQFFPGRRATGLAVELAPTHCGLDESDRFIALRVSNSGKVFLNFEEAPWSTLGTRLSEISALRENRTLYVLADDEIPYQTVAALIDLVQNAPASPESGPIKVRLITPVAKNVPCFSAIPLCRAPNASKRLVPCKGASLRGKPSH